jgi:hypothetical protein
MHLPRGAASGESPTTDENSKRFRMLLQTLTWQQEAGWSACWPAGMDSPATLAVAFGSTRTAASRAAVDDVRAQLPNSIVVGCSTAGEIFDARVQDASLSVAIAQFASARLRKLVLPIDAGTDSACAGRELGRALTDPSLRAVLVLCDGLHVNGSRLTAGLNEALPEDVVVTGGLAGDGERFASTWVYGDGATVGRC